MTTHTTISRIRHDSDATFREWIQEFEAALTAIGLVQTADTGQINTATANRPGSNTTAGYQIWRFNDTQQASRPIFLRFEYGTHNSTTGPRIMVGVGTGSNGAGTLTGQTSAAAIVNANAAQATDSTRASYFCLVDGTLSFQWKVGAGNSEGMLCVTRTVDNTGTADDVGFLVLSCAPGQFRARGFRPDGTIDETTTVNVAQLCHWPFSASNSLVGLDFQVATAWAPMPRMTPFVGVVGVLDSDAIQGTTFNFTGVGTTARTYMAANGSTPYMAANNALKPALIWE